MTVFKTFWKVVKKYKGTVILYTSMLIIFGTINMSNNDISNTFTNSKPNVLIVNNDENIGITKNLINYISDNTNIVTVKDNEEARDDAIFYRDVSYIIYIPVNYRNDILNGKEVTINIKSTGDYEASLANILLSRYTKIQNIYSKIITNEDLLIKTINDNLSKKNNISMTSKIDTNKSTNIARFFNFASYSIMAVIMYIICLVLSSFHEKNVNKRINISSMNYKKHNNLILLASFGFCIIIFVLYTLLGIILLNDIINLRGLIYIVNTFVFCFCALTIAILISNLTKDKNAISGIVNVLALGSAFLCGAFIPTEMMPESVLKIAHLLPAYWYINSNDILKKIETINFVNLKPIFINMVVILLFSIIFIIINNIVTKKKRVIS